MTLTERASQDFPPWQWNKGRLEAAVLLAEDELTDEEIAGRAGVTRRQLTNWKQHPEFRAKVDELASELEGAVLKRGIARRRHRVSALVDRHNRMVRLLNARAERYANDPEAEAGADTGLLVKQYKVIGQGPHAQTIVEWAFDAALMREMREHEKQVAQEVGEWTEKREDSSKLLVSGILRHDVVGDIAVRAVDYRQAAAALQPPSEDGE